MAECFTLAKRILYFLLVGNMTLEILEVNDDLTVYLSDRKLMILHRPNGPAAVRSSSGSTWYLNNKKHRYYGPARYNEWWIHDSHIK
jgi:hypothetical protein